MDADVRISVQGLYALQRSMHKHKYDLMTVFPTQICLSYGEQLVVPVMHRVLLTLLPLCLMKQSFFPSLSAANGQVMLFDAETYRIHAFHSMFRKEVVEDIAIVRYIKKRKMKAMCYLAEGWIECRMYRSYTACMEGFSKNVTSFFGHSYLIGLLYALLGIMSYGIILYIEGFDELVIGLLGVHLLTELFIAHTSKADWKKSLLYYPLRGGILTLLLWKSYFNKTKNKQIWKGRSINI